MVIEKEEKQEYVIHKKIKGIGYHKDKGNHLCKMKHKGQRV